MHAIVGTFRMDPSRQAEQRVELHERIIPMVRELPDFVSGTWSWDPATSRHYSHVVLRTEAAAQQLAAQVRENVAQRGRDAGVSLESLQVVEVIGDARR